MKAFSADVVANVLDKLKLHGIRKANEEVSSKAERNEAFRDGSYDALRCVAIDGWEPFSSYDRHCPHCLVRQVKVKRKDAIQTWILVPSWFQILHWVATFNSAIGDVLERQGLGAQSEPRRKAVGCLG